MQSHCYVCNMHQCFDIYEVLVYCNYCDEGSHNVYLCCADGLSDNRHGVFLFIQYVSVKCGCFSHGHRLMIY